VTRIFYLLPDALKNNADTIPASLHLLRIAARCASV
jgi:hypothetical protein